MKSIISNENRCYICGSTIMLQEHHIFFGTANRKLSEQYGLKVRLCILHHELDYGVHGKYGQELNNLLKKKGQIAFEKTHGTRQDFIRIFGKNYIE